MKTQHMRIQRESCDRSLQNEKAEPGDKRLTNLSKMTEAINAIRQGEADALEDLYLLTYKDTYSDICSFLDNEKKIWDMLEDVYVQIWNKRKNMPEANIIRLWIRVIIIDLAKNKGIEFSGEFSGGDLAEDVRADEKAAAALIEIEEELGIFEEAGKWRPNHEKSSASKKKESERIALEEEGAGDEGKRAAAYMKPYFLQLAAALFVTGIAVGLLLYVMDVINHNSSIKRMAVGFIPKSSEEVFIETSKTEENANRFGWNETGEGRRYRKENGRFMVEEWLEDQDKLYYFDDTGYMAVGMRVIGGQKCEFDQGGALIMISGGDKTEDNKEMLAQKFEKAGNARLEENIIDNSIKYSDGWVYFLLKNPESREPPRLMRFHEESAKMEIVAERAEGFLLLPPHIWYSADQRIERLDLRKEMKKAGSIYRIGTKEDLYGFYDLYGDLLQREERLVIDDRVYHLKEGVIEEIGEVRCRIGEDVLRLEKGDSGKVLSEDGSVFLTEDAEISAICSSGETLYYSVRADEEDEPFCRICRYGGKDSDKEVIVKRLPGAVRRMFCYGGAEVYLEYAPYGEESLHTRIAVMDEEGKLALIDEEGKIRESEKEEEILELLMIEGEKIYCYRKKGKWRKDKSGFDASSVSSLELDATKRIPLEAAKR